MVHQYHRKLWVYWRIFPKFDELQRHHHYLEIVLIEFLVLLYPFLPALTRRCLVLCSSALQNAGWDQQFASWKLESAKYGPVSWSWVSTSNPWGLWSTWGCCSLWWWEIMGNLGILGGQASPKNDMLLHNFRGPKENWASTSPDPQPNSWTIVLSDRFHPSTPAFDLFSMVQYVGIPHSAFFFATQLFGHKVEASS